MIRGESLDTRRPGGSDSATLPPTPYPTSLSIGDCTLKWITSGLPTMRSEPDQPLPQFPRVDGKRPTIPVGVGPGEDFPIHASATTLNATGR